MKPYEIDPAEIRWDYPLVVLEPKSCPIQESTEKTRPALDKPTAEKGLFIGGTLWQLPL